MPARPHKSKSDSALSDEIRQLEDQFQELRQHYGKSREDGHERVDARRVEAEAELAKGEDEYRYRAATRPLNAGDAHTLVTLWLAARSDEFAKFQHGVIDRTPAPGQGNHFDGMAKGDYMARHGELRRGIAEREAEQAEREAAAERSQSHQRIAKIRERATR